jgi:hypothetical protein
MDKPINIDLVTEKTDLDGYKGNSLLDLYKQFIIDIEKSTSRVKLPYRNIIRSMKKTIVLIKEQRDKLKLENDQLKEEVTKSTLATSSYKYANYSDCVKNREMENLVIIKKVDINSQTDLSKVVRKELDLIKKSITVRNIKINKNRVVVSASSKEDQQLLIENFKNYSEIRVNEPTKFVPNILIKEIQRIQTDEDEDRVDYKKYVQDELIESLNITNESDKPIVKVIINKKNFKTIRAVVSLSAKMTEKVILDGNVKIGYMSCPLVKNSFL